MAQQPTTHTICLTGGESTGKSELAEALFKYYVAANGDSDVRLVTESARQYLSRQELGPGDYTQDDLIEIAEQQFQQELRAHEKGLPPELQGEVQGEMRGERHRDHQTRIVICDTDQLVLKIWWQSLFSETPVLINQLFAAQVPRTYLLCAPDLAWQFDPLRESANKRWRHFAQYFAELRAAKAQFQIVCGFKAARLATAIQCIERVQ